MSMNGVTIVDEWMGCVWLRLDSWLNIAWVEFVCFCVFLCVHVMFVMIVYQGLDIWFRSSRQPWLTMRQPRLRRTSKDARGTAQSKRGVLTYIGMLWSSFGTHILEAPLNPNANRERMTHIMVQQEAHFFFSMFGRGNYGRFLKLGVSVSHSSSRSHSHPLTAHTCVCMAHAHAHVHSTAHRTQHIAHSTRSHVCMYGPRSRQRP